MRSITRRLASGLAIALLGAAFTAGPATADPVNAPNAVPVTVECGEAGTFDAVANGNGAFTPAHDLNSNAVLIPVSFGPTTFTVTNAEGSVVFQETEPGRTKGSGTVPPGRAGFNCSFSFSFPAEEGNTATVTGTVTGFLSGRSGRA
jgi:hypothetical protein